jgi:hypothetical protein
VVGLTKLSRKLVIRAGTTPLIKGSLGLNVKIKLRDGLLYILSLTCINNVLVTHNCIMQFLSRLLYNTYKTEQSALGCICPY